MYYVLEADIRLTTQFIYFRNVPNGFGGAVWTTGLPLATEPEKVSLIAEDEKADKYSDIALVDSNLLIFSPALRQTLSSLGIANLEYFPITLADATNGTSKDDYCVANVLGAVACLDADNSTVKRFGDGDIRTVKKFKLQEDKISAVSVAGSPVLLFRLAEFKPLVIAHESVKAACEKAGLTGIRFAPTDTYV